VTELFGETGFLRADELVAGVDEAGRGPLAGPVVAGAVILDPMQKIEGLDDSKKLSPARREALVLEIKSKALAWSVSWADAPEIDSINILHATMLAMRRALLGLRLRPRLVEVDGNRLPNLDFAGVRVAGKAIVGGDATIPAISAASILAKVRRDAIMRDVDQLYPGYGFAQHKGYGTVFHRESLQRLGPCPQHRWSFRPLSGMRRHREMAAANGLQ
jgi:ribonuclease HII